MCKVIIENKTDMLNFTFKLVSVTEHAGLSNILSQKNKKNREY